MHRKRSRLGGGQKEIPNAEITASDISEEALSLARENAVKNSAEINFINGDLFDAILGKFDIIAANPPYIKSGEIGGLEGQIKDFEPRLALDGGEDGLNFYRRIAERYGEFLNEGGSLILELGAGEADEVKKIFGGGETVKDYNTPPIERIFIKG